MLTLSIACAALKAAFWAGVSFGPSRTSLCWLPEPDASALPLGAWMEEDRPKDFRAGFRLMGVNPSLSIWTALGSDCCGCFCLALSCSLLFRNLWFFIHSASNQCLVYTQCLELAMCVLPQFTQWLGCSQTLLGAGRSVWQHDAIVSWQSRPWCSPHFLHTLCRAEHTL